MPTEWPGIVLVTRTLRKTELRGYTARITVRTTLGEVIEIREKCDVLERIMAIRWLSRTLTQMARGKTGVYVDHRIHVVIA